MNHLTIYCDFVENFSRIKYNILRIFENWENFERILWELGTSFVRICYKFCESLYKFCENLVQILWEFGTNFVRIWYIFCENLVKFCENLINFLKNVQELCEFWGKFWENLVRIMKGFREILLNIFWELSIILREFNENI